jgi:hypothetical protein
MKMEIDFIQGKATAALAQHIPVDHLRVITKLYHLFNSTRISLTKRGRPREVALNWLVYVLYKKLFLLLFGNEDLESHKINYEDIPYTLLIGTFLQEQRIRYNCTDDIDRSGLRKYTQRILLSKKIYRDTLPILLDNVDDFEQICRTSYEPLSLILPIFYNYTKRSLSREFKDHPAAQRVIKAFSIDYFSL